MLLYALCYAATLPAGELPDVPSPGANNVDADKSPYIFMWAPIAWALAGYFLTGWRWVFKTGEEGRDCLVLAAVLSVVMAVVCRRLSCPRRRRAGSAGTSVGKALAMLQDPSFLIFIIISMAAAGMMQFYFLGTAQFMQDNGISAEERPGRHGDCPGDAGDCDPVRARLDRPGGRLQVDADAGGRLLADSVRHLRDPQTAGGDRRGPGVSRPGVCLLHHRRADVRRRRWRPKGPERPCRR